MLLFIDDPYSLEQLRDPRMNLSVVRPLVDKLYELDDVSVVRSSGIGHSTCRGDRCIRRQILTF
ncbi:hypothetical protein M7I_3249 [Glarea lozoyensis 74030]|uniref:Uncharacterized protein n=1 Tax=Glarea lozoyensis (strain ATCC 74030 / MF5533) TaxID=1104152 RepID=H0EL13_GLAL7|nr:hypothetical protein M7I_3249 [Glarea lozoyensis 74030]